MTPHPLTNFEYFFKSITKTILKFNGVYSKNNAPKIKDGAYRINFYEYKSMRTYWIV